LRTKEPPVISTQNSREISRDKVSLLFLTALSEDRPRAAVQAEAVPPGRMEMERRAAHQPLPLITSAAAVEVVPMEAQ
jgi:hypothetical protein